MSNLFNEKVRDIKREQLINKRIEKYGPLLANADRRDLRNFQPDNFTFKADLNSIETLYNNARAAKRYKEQISWDKETTIYLWTEIVKTKTKLFG